MHLIDSVSKRNINCISECTQLYVRHKFMHKFEYFDIEVLY